MTNSGTDQGMGNLVEQDLMIGLIVIFRGQMPREGDPPLGEIAGTGPAARAVEPENPAGWQVLVDERLAQALQLVKIGHDTRIRPVSPTTPHGRDQPAPASPRAAAIAREMTGRTAASGSTVMRCSSRPSLVAMTKGAWAAAPAPPRVARIARVQPAKI